LTIGGWDSGEDYQARLKPQGSVSSSNRSCAWPYKYNKVAANVEFVKKFF